jgi:hypothetical protein
MGFVIEAALARGLMVFPYAFTGSGRTSLFGGEAYGYNANFEGKAGLPVDYTRWYFNP